MQIKWLNHSLLINQHLNPSGRSFWQALRRTLRVIGTFKLMPRMLALRAVHRQIAASKSASPLIKAQHLVPEGGFPKTTWTSPNTSAQTPSLRVSIGHLSLAGVGVVHLQHALLTGERVRRERMKMVEMSLVLVVAMEVKKS